MTDAEVEQIIRQYMPDVLHMSLATCKDNKPWVVELHYAFDDALNIYWRSMPDARHSQEIVINPNVAGTIMTQHNLEDAPVGVYFEGKAELVAGITEADPAYLALEDRYRGGLEKLDEARRPDGHKYYKIAVTDFFLFDARTAGPVHKYHLAWQS